MRVLLYLKAPDIEIALVVNEPAPRFGSAHGRAVFSGPELESVLDLNPSPSEFRVICAAKMALNGIVDAGGGGDDDSQHVSVPAQYSEDDDLYL